MPPPFRRSIGVFAFALLASFPAGAAECPALPWLESALRDPRTPECPTNGQTLLPDLAPPIAVVVSEDPAMTASFELARDFALAALEAAGERVPMVLLPGIGETSLAKLRAAVEDATRPGTKRAKFRKRWLAALAPVAGAEPFQWQQDYFKSTVDAATGLPTVRPVFGYEHKRLRDGPANARKVAGTAARACPSIALGPPVPPNPGPGYKFDRFAMGGNSLGVPGGVYLHGMNQDFATYGRTIASDASKRIEIDTSWLKVGHVDEITAFLPDGKRRAPCDFAVAIASPKLALELMRDPKRAREPFFAFTGKAAEASRRADRKDRPVATICDLVARHRNPGAPLPSSTPGAANPECARMAELTNGAVAEAMGAGPRPTLADFNALAQDVMDRNERAIRDAIARTGCRDPKFIRVPTLFYGDVPLEEKKLGELTPAERDALPAASRFRPIANDSARSILPNPTNSVLIGKTLLLADPQNAAFAAYLRTEYRKLGLPVVTVDTWSPAHVALGNLRCATNVLRVCRPAASPARRSPSGR